MAPGPWTASGRIYSKVISRENTLLVFLLVFCDKCGVSYPSWGLRTVPLLV